MATMMMMPPAPAPMPPSAAPPQNLLPRHHTNPNPNPNPIANHHHHHQLYLGNIPWDATEEEIIEECSIFGRVVSLSLVRDKETGKHKGFGFIEFADEESALCAKRNQKGLLCHGRQLKVCDPINKKKKQQPQQNSNSFPVKRPHEESADGEPQASAHKRLHIDVQLTHTNEDDGKSQSAAHNVLHSGCLPSHSNSNSVAINKKKKRSNEANSADDDESQQSSSSAIKRPCIIHLQLPRSSAELHEPYSPTSPGFVWPQNTRKIHQEGSHSQVDDKSSQQQMKKPTIIDHIDFSSALSSATVGVGGDLLVTDQGFINDLLNLSSLLRSACI